MIRQNFITTFTRTLNSCAKALVMMLLLFGMTASWADAAVVTHGPGLGHTTDSSIKVWFRTDQAASVQVEYKTAAASYPGTFSSVLNTTAADDFTGTIELTGLAANTAYDYRIITDGLAEVGSDGSFSTFNIDGSACSYNFGVTGDTDFEDGPYVAFGLLEARNPDFAIFTGDHHYGFEESPDTASYNTAYKTEFFSEVNVASIIKDVAFYRTWDDHDIGNNWDAGNSGSYQFAKESADDYIFATNPEPILESQGTYFDFSVCDTDFFILDTRAYRSPNTSRNSDNKSMLGTVQKEYFKSWLKNSTAKVKFVVSSVPFVDELVIDDQWSGFAQERQEIYDFISDNNIENVVVLSGDTHNVGIFDEDIDTKNSIYEFNVTPVANNILRASSTGSNVVCTNATPDEHYGMVSVNTNVSPATITFDAWNDDDVSVCSVAIDTDDLSGLFPTISSAADQIFAKDALATAISAITITESSTASITSTNDIRIRIPDSSPLTWDFTDTTAVIGGTASAKVSPTVSYEDLNKTLVLDVTSNFIASETLTISGLSFDGFGYGTGEEFLLLEVENDGATTARDNRSIKVNASVAGINPVWIGGGNNSLWSNPLNWSTGSIPTTGSDVIINDNSQKDIIVDFIADDLGSLTVASSYTGTIRFAPFVDESAQSILSVSGDIVINGGTVIFEGDSHIDSVPGTTENDGTGWRINASNLTIGTSAVVHSDGEGFEQAAGPGISSSDTNGAPGGSYGGLAGPNYNFTIFPDSSLLYGTANSPLSLGTGGSQSSNSVNGDGGAGGGALYLDVSGTVTVNGILSASGDKANLRFGSGSGGSVWIDASSLNGSGQILAQGGDGPDDGGGSNVAGSGGGGGRIDLSDIATYNFTGTLSADGGADGGDADRGRTGTISFPQNYLDTFIVDTDLRLGSGNFTFGDITVSNGATLSFDTNPDSGVGATIQASSITIDAGSALVSNALGYSSGDTRGPGVGDRNSVRGSGAGYGGRGGSTWQIYDRAGGVKYGTATSPVMLGSGGARVPASSKGGAGGGALRINVSGDITVNGELAVNGEDSTNNLGGGSGGSLWLEAGNLLGSGTISATGGESGSEGGSGGGGRIDLSGISNAFTGILDVKGGAVNTFGSRGYAGTIVFPSTQLSSFSLSNTLTLGNDIAYNFGDLNILSGGNLILDSDPYTNTDQGSGGSISAANVSIASGASLNADSQGHNNNSGPDAGRGTFGTTNRYGGGAYGGNGGDGSSSFGSPAGGIAYGDNQEPYFLGSGFRNSSSGLSNSVSSHGGGAVYLNVSGTTTIDGTISANGDGGTAGGSVYIVSKNLAGAGTISAIGGDSGSENGGGGGGRVSLITENDTFLGTKSISGGTGFDAGDIGTLYEQTITFTASPASPDLQTASDLGTLDTDNITSSNSLSFDISCVDTFNVSLYKDGVVEDTGVCSGTNVSLTSSGLVSGTYAYTATQETGGIESVPSLSLSVTVDLDDPVASGDPDLQDASDDGNSATDDITTLGTLTFDIVCETGSSVELLVGATTYASGTCVAGTVSLTNAPALVAGDYSFFSRQTDLAGNMSVDSGTLDVSIIEPAVVSSGGSGSSSGTRRSGGISSFIKSLFNSQEDSKQETQEENQEQEVSQEEIQICELPALVNGGLLRTSENIKVLQLFLTAQGLNPGPADGLIGPGTISALKDYQLTTGLVADGAFGPQTLAQMRSDCGSEKEQDQEQGDPVPEEQQENSPQCSINYTRLIRLGVVGEDVRQVQTCMNSLGYSTGIVDGWYGQNTYKGITSYQQDNNLIVDGIVGPQTAGALNALGE